MQFIVWVTPAQKYIPGIFPHTHESPSCSSKCINWIIIQFCDQCRVPLALVSKADVWPGAAAAAETLDRHQQLNQREIERVVCEWVCACVCDCQSIRPKLRIKWGTDIDWGFQRQGPITIWVGNARSINNYFLNWARQNDAQIGMGYTADCKKETRVIMTDKYSISIT